jgi:hypothetical protein
MAAQGKSVLRKTSDRRTTGHDALTTIRLSSERRESVDAWAAKRRDKPARPEAILQQRDGVSERRTLLALIKGPSE